MTRLLLLCLLGLAACQTSHPPQWIDGSVPSRSETLVYETLHFSLDKAGYPIGIGVDKGARTIETGWTTSLAPLKGKGYRQRAHVRYAPVADDRYGVSVRIERESNESLRPLELRYAKWESAPDNVREAERVLQIVRSYLAREEIDIGPAPGRRFER